MVYSMGLPGNEPMEILRGGWCRLRGGVRSLSLCRDQLPWSHWGRSKVRVSEDKENERERESRRETKLLCRRKMKIQWGF